MFAPLFLLSLFFLPSFTQYEAYDYLAPLLDEKAEHEYDPRIVGGKEVLDPSPYPWVAYFAYHCGENGVGHSCAASFIQSDILLTAAHCWDDACPNNDVKVTIATGRDLTQAASVVRTGVTRKAHHNFDKKKVHNDIALLFLDTPVTAVKKFPTLPSRAPTIGSTVHAAGYGLTTPDGNLSVILREVGIQIQNPHQCHYSDFTTTTQLCAGAHGKDTCSGDSGGPLFETTDCCRYPGSVLHGVTSYGAECGSMSAVYTRVKYFRTFIDNTIRQAGFENRLTESQCCACDSSRGDVGRKKACH